MSFTQYPLLHLELIFPARFSACEKQSLKFNQDLPTTDLKESRRPCRSLRFNLFHPLPPLRYSSYNRRRHRPQPRLRQLHPHLRPPAHPLQHRLARLDPIAVRCMARVSRRSPPPAATQRLVLRLSTPPPSAPQPTQAAWRRAAENIPPRLQTCRAPAPVDQASRPPKIISVPSSTRWSKITPIVQRPRSRLLRNSLV